MDYRNISNDVALDFNINLSEKDYKRMNYISNHDDLECNEQQFLLFLSSAIVQYSDGDKKQVLDNVLNNNDMFSDVSNYVNKMLINEVVKMKFNDYKYMFRSLSDSDKKEISDVLMSCM